MKFATTLATLTTLLATTLAAPIEPYNGAQSIHPTTLSQYSVWTGAINYATAWGRIFKSGHESDVTTLVTLASGTMRLTIPPSTLPPSSTNSATPAPAMFATHSRQRTMPVTCSTS